MQLKINQFGPSPSRLRHLASLRSVSPAMVNMAFAEWESMQLEMAIMAHDIQMLKAQLQSSGRKHVTARLDENVIVPLHGWKPKPGP